MKLLTIWFSFRGELKPLDFILIGFAPGILLGIAALLLDDALNARGNVFYLFLGFSLWPAAAMLTKVAMPRTPAGKNN